MTPLLVTVKNDSIVKELANAFDYAFNGTSEFCPPEFNAPDNFNIGLIVGPSGSGKTTIMNSLGKVNEVEWDADRAICSHFKNADDAKKRLGAVGLNSVPVMVRPFHVLSNGEKFRADLARRLEDGALIDEFTSVVDRNVAKSCAFAVQRYIRQERLKGVIFSTCHYDVINWLMADWTFDTATGLMSGRGAERRPEIKLEMLPAAPSSWSLFRNHHYLDANINNSARCWIAEWNGLPVGFASVIAFPNGNIKNGWREHRTVVLPEFQGLGIGVRISDAVGEIMTSQGLRYFSKTASYRMGEYRNTSLLWKPTSKNMKARSDYKHGRSTKESGHKHRHIERVCYSHEYVGRGFTFGKEAA